LVSYIAVYACGSLSIVGIKLQKSFKNVFVLKIVQRERICSQNS